MNRLLAPTLFLIALFGIGSHLPALEVNPGEVTRWNYDGIEDQLWLHAPKNYTPDRKWPVILWYHGTNAKPTIDAMRKATGHNDFFLVGMGYRNRGNLSRDPETLAKTLSEERSALTGVIDHLAERIQIDPKQVYIGGFSKGGWISAFLLELEGERLAGALICGAGILKGSNSRTPVPIPGKAVYIGVGDREANLISGRTAGMHFKSLKATVTVDEWEDTGHQWPPEEQWDHLKQWLRIEAHRGRLLELKEEAETWFAEVLEEAKADTDPVSQYLTISRMTRAPYFALSGEENRKRHAQILGKMRSGGPTKLEYQAEMEYRRVAAREPLQRSFANEKQRYGEYVQIAREFPGTHYAAKALIDAGRVKASVERRAAAAGIPSGL